MILSLTGKVKQTGQSVTTTNDGSTEVTTEATTYEYTWEAKDIFYGDTERTLGDSQ